MSKVLDVSVPPTELALKVGLLLLNIWQLERKVAVLEARVDELDPPSREG